jgi:hypothetical protein
VQRGLVLQRPELATFETPKKLRRALSSRASVEPVDSKIYLPRFHRFKFQFHSFFAETFSTV